MRQHEYYFQCVKFNRVEKLLVFINIVFINPCLIEHRWRPPR